MTCTIIAPRRSLARASAFPGARGCGPRPLRGRSPGARRDAALGDATQSLDRVNCPGASGGILRDSETGTVLQRPVQSGGDCRTRGLFSRPPPLQGQRYFAATDAARPSSGKRICHHREGLGASWSDALLPGADLSGASRRGIRGCQSSLFNSSRRLRDSRVRESKPTQESDAKDFDCAAFRDGRHSSRASSGSCSSQSVARSGDRLVDGIPLATVATCAPGRASAQPCPASRRSPAPQPHGALATYMGISADPARSDGAHS